MQDSMKKGYDLRFEELTKTIYQITQENEVNKNKGRELSDIQLRTDALQR